MSTKSGAFDTFIQDLRYGARNLRGRPGFTSAAVLILGLGIGAVTSIYSAVEALVLYPLPYPELERLVVVGEADRRWRPGQEVWTHPADIREWRTLPTFDGLAALDFSMPVLEAATGPERAVAYRASRNFFDLLGIAPARGRFFATAERGLSSFDEVVLSHRFWQRRLGGAPDVVGTSILVDGRPTMIVGVLPPGAGYPMGTDLWMPLDLSELEWTSFDSPTLRVVGKLATGMSVQEARRSLAGVASRLQEAHAPDEGPRSIHIQPLLDEVTWGSQAGLTLLGGASAFLLLLVCISVAQMQLARSTTRSSEMAVRAALGASRSRLVRQLLTEGSLLAAAGGLLGSALAVLGTRYMRAQLSAEGLRFFFTGVHDIRVDGSVFAVALATALGSTVLFGVFPALRASAPEASAALKGVTGRRTGGTCRSTLRRWLIGFQVAMSILLVAGAATLVRGTDALSRFAHGLEDEIVTLRVQLPADRYDTASRQLEYFSTALRRLRDLAGVRAVALSDALPSARTSTRELSIETPVHPDRGTLQASERVVGGEYFAALRMPLQEGRAFRPGDDGVAPSVGVVNRTLARQLGLLADVVGSRVRFSPDDPWTLVVGVVADHTRLRTPVATLYRPHTQAPRSTLRFLLHTDADPDTALTAAHRRLLSVDDSLPLTETGTLEEVTAERSRGLWLAADLMSAFATSAFLLALVGTYALVAVDAGRRTRELGIRLALGAHRTQLSTLLLREALFPVVGGTAIGLAAALIFTNRLARHRTLANALDPDPAFLAILTLALLAITALAAYLPAHRASTTDATTSLRTH